MSVFTCKVDMVTCQPQTGLSYLWVQESKSSVLIDFLNIDMSIQ
jgi:hypothetical protein